MKIIELLDTKGGKIFINCDRILWFQNKYADAPNTFCAIYFNDGSSVKVTELAPGLIKIINSEE